MTVLMGCNYLKNQGKSSDVMTLEHKTDPCPSKNEKEKMLETILGTPDFQMFLHPEVDGRLPVRLLINEFVTEDLELKSNGLPVLFEESLSISHVSVHRLRIIEADCKNQIFSYSIFYPIEGAIITGTAKKNDTTWLITDTNWGIKD